MVFAAYEKRKTHYQGEDDKVIELNAKMKSNLEVIVSYKSKYWDCSHSRQNDRLAES
jgi:hypothetical protein